MGSAKLELNSDPCGCLGRHNYSARRIDDHCPSWLGDIRAALIKARTDEGRKRAQARGVRFGRPVKLSRYQIEEALSGREAGEALADIGRSYGVSHSTISGL